MSKADPRVFRNLCVGLIAVLMILAAHTSEAEVSPGVRAGAYFDASSPFVGVEILARVANSWYINPNVEYIFQDRVNFFTFNFDFHYDFPTHEPVYLWAGAGLAILHRDPDNRNLESKTDPGVNLLMGVGFNKGGSVIPYIQGKAILSDNSDFSLAFGLRF